MHAYIIGMAARIVVRWIVTKGRLHLQYLMRFPVRFLLLCLLFIVYCLLFIIYCLLFIVYCLLFIVYCLLSFLLVGERIFNRLLPS